MKRYLWSGILGLLLAGTVCFGYLVYGADEPVSGLKELEFDGGTRTYILHLPKDSGKEKLPLLIALHWTGGTAAMFESGTIEFGSSFNAKADTDGFAVVYPNGAGPLQLWNIGGAYEEATNHTDDVGFISKLIDTLAAKYPIDTSRVCVTGFSLGSFMAYRLARELSYKVTAIAPIAGTSLDVPFPAPEQEVSILHIHSLDDSAAPFMGCKMEDLSFLPVETVLAYWIQKQKCNPKPVMLLDNKGIQGRLWKSESGHGDVYLYTTLTGGHRWPRKAKGGLEATDLISKFFLDLPKRK